MYVHILYTHARTHASYSVVSWTAESILEFLHESIPPASTSAAASSKKEEAAAAKHEEL